MKPFQNRDFCAVLSQSPGQTGIGQNLKCQLPLNHSVPLLSCCLLLMEEEELTRCLLWFTIGCFFSHLSVTVFYSKFKSLGFNIPLIIYHYKNQLGLYPLVKRHVG